MKRTQNRPGEADLPTLGLKKELAFLLDDILRLRDPEKFRDEQMPRLRELVEKFKKKGDGI